MRAKSLPEEERLLKILHVSQGMPPFRTGGMNLYCDGLMRAQTGGHTVSLLYPGRFLPGGTRIRSHMEDSFHLFEIINPLPLPLVFGVAAPTRYMVPCRGDCYGRFLAEERFDIIHVHCLMGIHREFFEAAHALGIPMIFTTHDYYPLCFRCNLFDAAGRLCPGADAARCRLCNAGKGLSHKAEVFMQSRLYGALKYTGAMKRLRARGRRSAEAGPPTPGASAEEYGALTGYYRDILRRVDVFHCNSDTAREIYARALPGARFETVPIPGAACPAAPRTGKRPESRLRIGYLGGDRPEKGLSVLLEALRQLDARGRTEWELQLYGGRYAGVPVQERIRRCGTCTAQQLPQVYAGLDVAVVPSLWYETFGLVTREALSFGVPAVASDRVGSAMLLESAPFPLTYPAENAAALADVLGRLGDPDTYARAAGWAAQSGAALTMQTHAGDIGRLYEQVIGYRESPYSP